MDAEKRTEQLTFRLRPDLLRRLNAIKARKERSLAWLLEKCLEQTLPTLEHGAEPMRETPTSAPQSAPKPVTYKRRKEHLGN